MLTLTSTRRAWTVARRLPPSRLLLVPRERVLRQLVPMLTPRRISGGSGGGWPRSFCPLPSPYPESHDGLSPDGEVKIHGCCVLSRTGLREPLAALDRYHFHYLDWLGSLPAIARETWVREWLAARWTRSVGDPYVLATRSWTLCRLLHGDQLGRAETRQLVEQRLRSDYAALKWLRERSLGGNHLLRDLKALFGLAVFLRESRPLMQQRLNEFTVELARQLFADGLHVERSPRYHALVLGDALDVLGLAVAAQLEAVEPLIEAVLAMQRVLGALTHQGGDLAYFNDSPRLRTDYVDLLLPGETGMLGGSGFVRLDVGALTAIFDAGKPSPPELPGHAHAEALSFELSGPQGLLFRNCGTSTYQAGERRSWERSTLAHNTVTVDSCPRALGGVQVRLDSDGFPCVVRRWLHCKP